MQGVTQTNFSRPLCVCLVVVLSVFCCCLFGSFSLSIISFVLVLLSIHKEHGKLDVWCYAFVWLFMLTFQEKEKRPLFSHTHSCMPHTIILSTSTQFMLHSHETMRSVDICLAFFCLTYFTLPNYWWCAAALPLIFKRIWCMGFIWFIFIHQKLSCFPLGVLSKIISHGLFTSTAFLFLLDRIDRDSHRKWEWISSEPRAVCFAKKYKSFFSLCFAPFSRFLAPSSSSL